MNRLRLHLDRNRRCAAAIVALALALRVLVPAGYMPAFDRGAVGVRICGSQIAQPMPSGMHHHGAGHEDNRNHADQPCAFAGLAAPAGPPPTATLVPVAWGAQVPFSEADRGPIALGGTRSRPFARGPPLLA